MPEERGLLVARDAAYRYFPAEKFAVGKAEVAAAGLYLGQHRAGHAEEF